MTTMILRSGYARDRKSPETAYRHMTVAEAKELTPGMTVPFLANDGTRRDCKVNGKPKTWKREPNRVVVPIKYGLYDYGRCRSRSDGTMERLLVEARPNEESKFLAGIVAAGKDCFRQRCEFADWLREQGRDAEAAWQAWLAREGKYPDSRRAGGWFSTPVPEAGVKMVHCLPTDIFWPTGRTVDNFYGISSPTAAERWFLIRSAELGREGVLPPNGE